MDEQKILAALDAIVHSATFSKSATSRVLLDYLTKATLKGADIKEFSIANEVFRKENDSGIRAYILTLRRKLDEYYEKEGRAASIIFSIPKGQYSVFFTEASTSGKPVIYSVVQKILQRPSRLVAAFLVVMVPVVALCFLLIRPSTKIENTLVWQSVMQSSQPRLIVVGDHFFFGSKEIISGGHGIIRDFNINSRMDYDKIRSENERITTSTYPINWSYITRQGLYMIYTLMPHVKHTENCRVILASELTLDMLKQFDIFYFGKYQTTGIIGKLITDRYYQLEKLTGNLSCFLSDTTIHTHVSINDYDKADSPMLLSFETPYHRKMMMIVGMDDPGITAVLDYCLDVNRINALESKLQISKSSPYFMALFQVNGLERTDYSIEYVAGERLAVQHQNIVALDHLSL